MLFPPSPAAPGLYRPFEPDFDSLRLNCYNFALIFPILLFYNEKECNLIPAAIAFLHCLASERHAASGSTFAEGETNMRKLKGLFLALAFSLTVLATASAGMTEYSHEIPSGWDASTAQHFVLRDGDQMHCLTLVYEPEYLNDYNDCLLHMEAVCREWTGSELVPCQSGCAGRFVDRLMKNKEIPGGWTIYGMAVSPQNQTYLIDWDHTVYHWTPDQEEPWTLCCRLTIPPQFDEFHREIWSADEDKLYLCCELFGDDDTGEGTAYAFSMADGQYEELFTMPTLYELYPGVENGLAFYGRATDAERSICFYQYDFQTKEAKIIPCNPTGGALLTDGRGGWYSAGTEALYHIDAEGAVEKIADLPEVYNLRTVTMSGDGRTAYVLEHDNLIILTLDEPSQELSLTLAGNVNEYGYVGASLPDFATFSQANGHAQLNISDTLTSFDDLARELVSGSGAFDLMVLEKSAGNVDSLLDKGYYVDLSDNPVISAYVESLYPAWRDECVRDGRIAGIPIGLRNVWTFFVNKELWNEMDLGAYPKTYDELFDRILSWDSQGVLDEARLFDTGSSYEWLFNRIMKDAMGKCKRESKPIVFSDETFLHLLNRLEEVKPILDAHDARHIQGRGLICEGALWGIIDAVSICGFEVTSDNSTFEPLPLGLTGENDCVESVFFSLLVINPNTPQPELAEAYLTYIAGNPTTWTKLYLLDGGIEGVRRAEDADLDERYQREIPELQEKIAEAKKAGDEAAVFNLEKQVTELTDRYLNAWEVRPNLAEMVREAMPYWTPLTYDGYTFLQKNCSDLTDLFLSGRMDARTYLARLDERMRMVELEGGN